MSVQVYDRPRAAGARPYLLAMFLVIAVLIAGAIGVISMRAHSEQAAPTPYSEPDAPRPGIDNP
jgi:hypothetical protein